ncbi:MAG TPA: FtsX-like permease family protein, partial [Phycisphaerales bacterium]|nr:FtsX-like permease family protein [Phycisphaerales bacterium]
MFLFRLKRTLKLGAKSLWMHRLRSTLTALGIVFGVCSVIAMLAIGEGASQEAQDQIARLGSTNIIIRTIKPAEEQRAQTNTDVVQAYGLTYADAERIRLTVPGIEQVVPKRLVTFQTWYRNRVTTAQVIGTVPWYPNVHPVRLVRGRFLSSVDLDYHQKVCVVDEPMVEQLFIVDDPMDMDVKINEAYYRVIGIVTSTGPMSNGQTDASQGAGGGVTGNVYIPLTSMQESFGDTTVQFVGGTRQAEKVELQELTVQVKETDDVLPTRDILESLLQSFHTKKDYQIVVPLELLRQAARTKRIFSIVLGSIAAISLLVGGIGIMNIMLATVSERTREIGIRRALGAKQRDIVVQFLSETLMLTLAGGVLGIVLGCFIPILVTYFGHMPTVITGTSLLLAFGISGAIGLTFGL